MASNIQDFLGFNIHQSDVEYKIEETVITQEYRRDLIEYLGSENDRIRAYLFMPVERPIIGGVLVHHQHHSQRNLGKSEVSGVSGDPFQFFCPELAKRGIVSIAPDSICFEDRRANKSGIEPDADPENDWLQHYNEMCYRLLKGSSLMQKIIEDSSIGLSVLLQQKGIPKGKVGILGHSYGGNTVLFHSPFDHRIKYACSSGAACSYKTKFANNTGIEMAEVIPNFVLHYDIGDLLKLIPPRQILIVSGNSDKYSQDAKQVYHTVRRQMENADLQKCFHLKEYEGGHELNRERFEYIIHWFVDTFESTEAIQ